ncbi:MAG: PD40 domain-containing protein [Candidatus Latescibacteria bacterium]|nr:PD40 domain-containing protein [Candidatus Latescibacterota bacterium]
MTWSTGRSGDGGRRVSRTLRIALACLAACFALAGPSVSEAQYFGQNKVQYKSFHWEVLKTEHFDVYYYRGEETAVRNAALMAERGYQRLSRVLDHQIRAKIPLVLYASHTDFEQTNITPELLGVGTGGVTEFLKRRVFLPFTGSYAELDHVLTHELVHAFQVDVLFGDRQSLVANPFASTPPIWFMEGMAEYLSIAEIDNNTKMWLRDASLEGYLTPLRVLEYVGDIRVYRFGQSIFQFIADTYGVQKIGEILKKTRRLGSLDRALESATGLTVDVLSKKWTEAVRKEYLPQIADFDKPDAIAAKLTDAERDLSNFNVAPSVSPSGTQMVFISDRSMYNDVYLASALDGKIFKKLVSGERTGSFETLRFFNTSIAWSPDEKQIALPAKIGGQDAIYLIEIPSGKVVRKLKFGLDAIYSPAWSPDGSKLAFVGIKAGHSQLYLADADGTNLEEIFGGMFAVRDPAWSPDGTRIAFATDQGPDTNLDQLIFGKLRIAVLDVASRKVTVLPNQRGMNISPHWGPQGESIVFVSDRSGIPNIYRMDLAGAGVSRLTDLLTGVSGIVPESPCISLSRDGKRLLVSAFTRGGWDIYSVRDVPKFLSTPPVIASPSVPENWTEGAPLLAQAGAQEGAAGGEWGRGLPRPEASAPPAGDPAAEDSVRSAAGGVEAEGGAGKAATGSARAAVDTTLALYVRQVYREPLVDSTTFRTVPYKARFSRDYVTGGAFFASNVGFAGSTIMSFSDVLGNHNIIAALNLFGDLSNSDIYLAYSNLSHRTNYTIAAYQYRLDLLLLSSGGSDEVESQIYRGGAFLLSRPFSRFRRFEYGVEAAALDKAVLLYNYEVGTVSQQTPDKTFFYVAPNIGLVADNALYGSTGPINGGRSSYTASHALGDLSYTTLVMDWRRYANIRHAYSLAQRLIAATSFGRDPRVFRFGGAFTYRGVDYGDLRGSTALLGNLEFRFPLIEQIRLGWPGRISIGGINGVMFLDAASAWDEGTTPRFFTRVGGFHARDLLLAYGFGARVNLGYFILRYDLGRRTDLRHPVGSTQHFFTFGADF